MTIRTELKSIIAAHFGVDTQGITQWRNMDGCNHNYSFCVNGEKFVIRKLAQPHADTVHAEQAAYAALKPLGVSDEVLYLDDKGIKISRFLNGAALSYDKQDQADALDVLRKIHQSRITIPYQYAIFGKIREYAAFCDDSHAENLKILEGYQKKIDAIKARLDALNIAPVLCHGDACVSTNSMRLEDGSLRFIDWEAAGMADPIQDLALAAAHQGVENVDPWWCLEHYLQRKPDANERFRLRAYFTLGCLELAAWQINEDGFQDEINYAAAPYGLF
jgi:thiamine kinase-like enzyme